MFLKFLNIRMVKSYFDFFFHSNLRGHPYQTLYIKLVQKGHSINRNGKKYLIFITLRIQICAQRFGEFRLGNLLDSLRSGRLSSFKIEVLQAVLVEYSKQTSRQVARQYDTSQIYIIKCLQELIKLSNLGQCALSLHRLIKNLPTIEEYITRHV